MTATIEPSERDFQKDAGCVLAMLRRSVATLLDTIPGGIRSAGDVQRGLGLDKALSWQVYRLGTVADPIEAGTDVPARAAMVRAVKAARKEGVSESVTAEVLAAIDAFEALVERHADDRETFNTMIRGLREDDSHVHTRERRAAYRANAAVWGFQAKGHYNLSIFGPSEDGKSEDCVHVVGRIGFRALRAGLKSHMISRSSFWNTSEHQGTASEVQSHAIGLITEFSTSPFPVLKHEQLDGGKTAISFASDAVGKAGEVTYFVRDLLKGIGPMPQEWWGSVSLSRVPTETGVMDMLVPAGWSNTRSATVVTYGSLGQPERSVQRFEKDRLPIQEQIEYLGTSLDMLRTPHVPRCPELVRHVLAQAGPRWANRQYDLYRVVIEYPVLQTGVATRVERVR